MSFLINQLFIKKHSIRSSQMPNFFNKINNEIWLIEDDRNNMKLGYRVKEIISSVQSQIQQIDIAELYDFGKTLVLDGVIQTTEQDGFIYNEMISHIPLVTHPNPEHILIIGGGDCGVISEVLKYKAPKVIDMVEIDELVVRESINYLPNISENIRNDPRVNLIYEDGVKFVKKKSKYYDIVIIDASDPVGPAAALYSENFFIDVRSCLKNEGVISCQGQSPIFNSEILINTYTALKRIFNVANIYTAVVPSYPGGLWSFIVASMVHSPFQANINNLTQNTRYINQKIFKSCFRLPNFMDKFQV